MKLLGAAVALSLLGSAAFAGDLTFAGAPGMTSENFDTSVDDRSGFGINVGVSTLGKTFEPVWREDNHWGVRLPIGNGSFAFDDEFDGERFEGDLEIGGFGLVTDYFPNGGGFHLSAGAFMLDYSADLARRGYDIGNGMTTDIEVKIRQKKEFAPYLGMGYEGHIGKHASVSFDAGALFSEGFDVTASESSGIAPQSVVDDTTDDIRDAVSKIGAIPYVKLAVGFRF